MTVILKDIGMIEGLLDKKSNGKKKTKKQGEFKNYIILGLSDESES
jgi:hypothetical protein